MEHAINYRTEIHVGDEVIVSARLDGRIGKALYYSATLFNRSRAQLASSMTAVLLHVDLETRRACDFDDSMAAMIDGTIDGR